MGILCLSLVLYGIRLPCTERIYSCHKSNKSWLYLTGGLDWRHVFRSRLPLILELDLLCLPHSGRSSQNLCGIWIYGGSFSRYIMSLYNGSVLDWIILHDKSLLGRHCNTILWDQEERNGKNEGWERKIFLHNNSVHSSVQVCISRNSFIKYLCWNKIFSATRSK